MEKEKIDSDLYSSLSPSLRYPVASPASALQIFQGWFCCERDRLKKKGEFDEVLFFRSMVSRDLRRKKWNV
ncbi:hypothetical protein L195_g043771 [Trifolium pratense]|uniref:Uncharacterized protein n=1 Tax=Trifolium pratense TaxID=57577 RepID=A0A2K3MA64_TRIPR|nr:hypothetical protein L195_g043771 [Trifolium pratense]